VELEGGEEVFRPSSEFRRSGSWLTRGQARDIAPGGCARHERAAARDASPINIPAPKDTINRDGQWRRTKHSWSRPGARQPGTDPVA